MVICNRRVFTDFGRLRLVLFRPGLVGKMGLPRYRSPGEAGGTLVPVTGETSETSGTFRPRRQR